MIKRWAAVGFLAGLAALAFVAGRYSGGRGAAKQETGRHVLYYVDPMHPSYRSDKPGIAPDCGMDLVPVYDDAAPGGGLRSTPGDVSVSADQQRLLGVRVETVKKSAEPRLVRTTGRVEVDAERLYRMMAGGQGWVMSVQNNPVGTRVKKDELLATLYSQELRNVQQAYLGSLASLERLRGGAEPKDLSKGTDVSLRVNEERLRALGMGEFQLRELRKTREITSEIQLRAPVDGIVLSRDISPGQRFDLGAEFYRIADLSKVWITANILGEQAESFPPGAGVRVAVRERAAIVHATVSNTPPFFDSETRTLKLRLAADNPGFVLRPDMFVEIELPARTAPALTVPEDAVLDSGLSKRVFVERGAGLFEPRAVETGWRSGDRIEIVKGLEEGERVVVSGTFLLDSESRLRTTAMGVREPESAPAGAGAGEGAPPRAGQATDPTCGMTVDAAAAAAAGNVVTYHGTTYHFCSSQCKATFEKQPERYTVAARGSARHD